MPTQSPVAPLRSIGSASVLVETAQFFFLLPLSPLSVSFLVPTLTGRNQERPVFDFAKAHVGHGPRVAGARERQCLESRHDAKPLLTPMRVCFVCCCEIRLYLPKQIACDVVQKGVLGRLQTPNAKCACGGGVRRGTRNEERGHVLS